MKEDRQPIKLPATKLYNTYQICCCIYPNASKVSVHDVFNKVVLYIMDWYRSKTNGDVDESLKDYPSPVDFHSFDIMSLPELKIRDPFHVNAFYYEEYKNWTFRLSAPDSGIEFEEKMPTERIEGRSFIDNISVKESTKFVTFSYKCACKEPLENQIDSRVIRPLFIKTICRDNSFLVKELPDTSYDYDQIRSNAITVQENACCNHLATDLILNDKRQLPVLLLTGNYAEEDMANSIAERLLGFCHVFSVHDTQFARLFKARLSNNDVEKGDVVLYKQGKSFTKLELDDQATKEERIEAIKIEIRKYPLRKKIDYRDTLFYREAKTRKYYDINTNDPEELKKTIKQQREELDADSVKIKQLEADSDYLQEQLTKVKHDRDRAKAENEKVNKRNDSILQENTRLKQQNRELDAYKKLLKYIAIFPKNTYDIPQWIKVNFSGQLIMHSRAEKELAACKQKIDIHMLCSALLYLNAYMLCKRKEISKEELDIYKYNYPWDVTLCGNTSIQQYSEDYTIDLSRYATKENNAVLDQHIKYGRQSETLVRIYFTIITIDGTEKLIIGSLPEHLKTVSDPH